MFSSRKPMFATNLFSKSIKNADQNLINQLFLLKDQIKENIIAFFFHKATYLKLCLVLMKYSLNPA